MQGDRNIIALLNKVLKNELTAINQYFLHARMFGHWGFEELNEYEYKQSVDEMKDADKLIERILFLEGLPNLQDLGRLRIGENVEEALRGDLALEMDSRRDLVDSVGQCETAQDYVSRDLLSGILEGEEGHINWLETQLGLMTAVGKENYLQKQMESGD